MPAHATDNRPRNVRQERLEGIEAPRSVTVERKAFVDGLLLELQFQLDRYLDLTRARLELEAHMQIVERNLRATRDHIWAVLDGTDEDVPDGWEQILDKVRFVGARLGDACATILKSAGTNLTTQELLDQLNQGQYRFRTGSPLREIHGALLRQQHVRREGDTWAYEDDPPTVEEGVGKTA